MIVPELGASLRERAPHAASLLDRLGGATPAADAPSIIESGGRTITREALVREARAYAIGFAAVGLRPGEFVLFAARPSIDALALALALIDSGAVLVPADVVGESVFEQRMALVRPRWVVAESLLLAASASAVATRLLRRRGVHLPPLASVPDATFVRVGRSLPGVPPAISARDIARAGRTHVAAGGPSATILDPADAQLVVFTSGTTGAPKGVVHSGRSVRATFDAVGAALDARAGDVVATRELHLAIPALCVGASVLLPRGARVSPRHALADLERYGVTHAFGVAADWQRIAEHCTAHRRRLPATLRMLLMGAAPVHAPALRRLREVVSSGTCVRCVYGMTEMLPISYVDLEEKLAFDGLGDLVGTPLSSVCARIAPDGELHVRGPALCTGYLGASPITELATGDLARLEAGRLVLLGRRKDMIVRGEHNVYPELYEPTIERISGVRRCAMVGIYDEAAADERIVLGVEPEPGVEAAGLAARVRSALRAGPLHIDAAAFPDFVLVMALPECGRSSKIDKEALRAVAAKRIRCVSR